MIPERERLTETQRINTIREALQLKAQDGLLGMIAARAAIAEYRLHEWCNDPSKVPTYGELLDIQHALSIQVLYDPSEFVGDDCEGCGHDTGQG